jgi:uncharacterized protein YqeY
MSLYEKIQSDMKEAMKSRDTLRTNTLRFVIAAVKNFQASSEENRKGEVTDDTVIGLIGKEVKRREESIEAYVKAGRNELVAQETLEMEILKDYLPEELSENDIRSVALKTIEDLKANGPSDLGKVMREVMVRLKGRADGKLTNKIVRELLESR